MQRHVGLCRVRRNRRIKFPSQLNGVESRIAPASDVHLVVDDTVGHAAGRMWKWHGCGEISPAVRDRVVGPRPGLFAAEESGVIPADNVNLASTWDVAGRHEGAYVRHGSAGGPTVGGDVIDLGVVEKDVVNILTAEHVNLVGSRIIHCNMPEGSQRYVRPGVPAVRARIVTVY